MVKFMAIVLCVFLAFSAVVCGDTITLRNNGKDIDLKVVGVTVEYVNAIILKKDIESLKMQFLNTNDYPDVILLNKRHIKLCFRT